VFSRALRNNGWGFPTPSPTSTPLPYTVDPRPQPTVAEPERGTQEGGASAGRGGARRECVFVDEHTCIGCYNCAMIARNTFYMEDAHGRARAFQQKGDSDDVVDEAIAACPVDCIHRVRCRAEWCVGVCGARGERARGEGGRREGGGGRKERVCA
jgi:ferredoxin